ncbi:hypothetical protein GCM10027072_57810 [Streptomyces bullii]
MRFIGPTVGHEGERNVKRTDGRAPVPVASHPLTLRHGSERATESPCRPVRAARTPPVSLHPENEVTTFHPPDRHKRAKA